MEYLNELNGHILLSKDGGWPSLLPGRSSGNVSHIWRATTYGYSHSTEEGFVILRTYKGIIHNLDVFAWSFFYGWAFVKMGCAGITYLFMVQCWYTDQFTFITGLPEIQGCLEYIITKWCVVKIFLQVLMLFGSFVGTLIYFTVTPLSPLFELSV